MAQAEAQIVALKQEAKVKSEQAQQDARRQIEAAQAAADVRAQSAVSAAELKVKELTEELAGLTELKLVTALKTSQLEQQKADLETQKAQLLAEKPVKQAVLDVELSLNTEFKAFTSEKQKYFIFELAQKLHVLPGVINITNVKAEQDQTGSCTLALNPF